ncbi:hypothetical protein M5119_10745 [Lacticaseibacillus paracasei]|jgi:hypothetical protein|uniref:Uncharacterized protein n=1 Tax=Lacticaseibacillus paracasei subsp. paracasei Lpp41 TaxID=1256208 RepID=A0A829H372_LACPA|nr:hypothetical protein [Lacticaseibacillus paracasei]EKQ18206.1 hypothetical protein LCAUW4_2580 [Lacticaseibacillus casei UW4]EPC69856.1 hypothetical protein Lpp41_16480 [Lacticaseibacillus paracasei subsp. paracasei Lpp41]MBU6045405.1 hypothetical protein [Lacticaseibacillus paracasei]MBU6048110.1 hypothetical protein [Lacticaseibacillus paracasei]MCL4970227.1 hypothetical protein [Lacticaseibacillus paracasei]
MTKFKKIRDSIINNWIPIASFIVSVFVAGFTIANIWLNTAQIHKINQEKMDSARQAQASNVAAWITKSVSGDSAEVELSNQNQTPVFNVFVLVTLNNGFNSDINQDLKFIADNSLYSHYDVLPPNRYISTVKAPTPAMGGKRPIAFIFFTDANNRRWIREPSGKLRETDYNKILAKYQIVAPFSNYQLTPQ